MKLIRATLSILLSEFLAFVEFFVVYFPPDRVGQWLRYHYWRYRAKVGEGARIDRGALIQNPRLVSVGSFFVLGENAVVSAGECKGILIGNYVGIARGAYLRSANHKISQIGIPFVHQGHEAKTVIYNDREYSIVVEDDVWIGANAIVLTGTKIGKGAVVGAGAVISGVFPDYSIIMGNPGRVIGSRLKK